MEPGRRLPGPEAWQSHGGVPTRSGLRLAWLDMVRGTALIGMAAYHAVWDLHAFGLTNVDPGVAVAWHGFGQGVAAVFLFLSGMGLGLAARRGTSALRTMLRLGRIVAAAALVTFVTVWAVPQAPIWFGILHCIAVTNVIALALRRVPTPVLLAVAAAALAAPWMLRGAVGWSWVGLAASEPATLDFRPVLPWLAPVLAGMVLGRTSAVEQPMAWLTAGRWLRPLAWAGHHSLAMYLLHQPVMIGILVVALGHVPERGGVPDPLEQPDQAIAFIRQCRATCLTNGVERELCASTCHCVMTAIRAKSTGVGGRRWPFASPVPSLEDAVKLCRQGHPSRP